MLVRHDEAPPTGSSAPKTLSLWWSRRAMHSRMCRAIVYETSRLIKRGIQTNRIFCSIIREGGNRPDIRYMTAKRTNICAKSILRLPISGRYIGIMLIPISFTTSTIPIVAINVLSYNITLAAARKKRCIRLLVMATFSRQSRLCLLGFKGARAYVPWERWARDFFLRHQYRP